MRQVFLILFGAAFSAAVSFALGKLLLRGLSLRFYRNEEGIFAFVVGAALLSTITFGLCAAGLARVSVFLLLGAAILTVAAWRGVLRSRADLLPALNRFWRLLFGVVFAFFFVLYFFNALAPEISPDGSTYHLGLVARYLREHGFHRITTHMYANLSQGAEMLFLYAFAFGRHSSAALVHLLFLLALPFAMLCYGRRFGFPSAAACGALLFFLSPVVGLDGSSAYNDVAVACAAFTLFYLLQIWDSEPDMALLAPAGLLAGFCYAIKYTAFLAAPYAAGYVAWKLYRRRRPWLRPVLVVAACSVLVMTPWIARNWIWYHNPFSPFLNRWFPNPYIHVAFEQDYARYMRNYSDLKSGWQIPPALMTGGELAGILGPVFWLAPLGLLSLRWSAGRKLCLAALVFGITYTANIGTRFLIPALPFVSLAMGLTLAASPGVAPLVVLFHAFASWPGVVKIYAPSWIWRLREVPIRAALRLESEDSFLSAKLPGYGVARMIERLVPPNGKVFAFTEPSRAYTSREILIAYQAAFNQLLSDILLSPLMDDVIPTSIQAFRFPAQPVRRIRVVQTGKAATDLWSVSEMRVFRNNQELVRAPEWRLRAKPNPWDVQLAFDNSPVTRWRSWQALYPGMYIEIDLGRLQTIDSVVLECSHDQLETRLKLEGGASQIRTLALAPEMRNAPLPRGLRRLASQELKIRGIEYLLISDTDFGAEDFRSNSSAWGITLMESHGSARLYHID